jgi:hypothetical protein
MSDEKEQTIMVCIRIADSRDGQVAANSTIANCSECDEPIWMSRASQDQMVETDARPVCMQCFTPPKDAQFLPPTKEVIKELLDHITHEEKPTDRLGDRTTKG